MAISLSEYVVAETLYEGSKTIVYRGKREKDNLPVVIKVLNIDFPSLREIASFKQEYQVISSLDHPGVIKAYELITYQNHIALILEDFGGQSLKQYINSQKLELLDFLKIAIQITTALGIIHQNNIIHKDIKSKNIVLNPNTGKAKIIDFSISSQLSKENPLLSNPELLEGTLFYIAPEQTGRMNRVIDYRSDLYSLGITFYELLTGALPFQSHDPLELIHCHIAKQPIPPHKLQPQIPIVLSDIVMKLLSKNAEDRYQSTFGLKVDLELCLAELEINGEISNFAIAKHDLSGKLLIPQKLYGRELEVDTLINSFARVSRGVTEMLLVSGYSGIGKSSLVNEIYQPILKQRGYFINGKFDQFKRDIPYASLIQAFQGLIQQLLSETTDSLQKWRKKLLSKLGNNAQVIIEVIPELELIIGSQPSVPQLGASESQNRFNRLFQEFIRVFAQPEHPLVLFLDDLQWADAASLKLIQVLITDPDSQYLLLLGAYRDNEVSSTHPLIQTIAQIQQDGATVNNIVLSSLDLVSINQLLSDTLHPIVATNSLNIESLSQLLFDKTQGNPFFLTQLLKSLAQKDLIKFDFEQKSWWWNIDQIQSIGVTDNVVELMTDKIQKLPIATQNILKLAACIGNRFDLETLAVINEKSLLNTAQEIWAAIQEGLILPLNEAYRIPLVVSEATAAQGKFDSAIKYQFLHDRVQQAAYTLIPEDEKKATHFKIGQLLLQDESLEKQSENIFELVNQLNYGIDLISEPEQKKQLAELNLIAGKKAKAAIAYEPATQYLNIGLNSLSNCSWQTAYELTLDLYDAAIDLECINANYQQSQALINTALKKSQTLLDRVRIYKRQIQLYIAQGNLPASIDTALAALELLGVTIPTEPEAINQYCQQLRDELVFTNSEIAQLADLAPMSDPKKQAAMEVLNTMPGPVYIVRPQLFLPMMLTMTSLSVKYGNWVPSSFAYCVYGMLLCAAFGNIDAGYEFGQLSLKVLEQFNDKSLYCHVMKVYSTHIHPCKNHIRSAIDLLHQEINVAVETANIEFLGYGAGEWAMYQFFSGENLETVNQKVAPYVELVESFKQDLGIYYIKIARQVVLNLLGEAEDKFTLTGESFNEETMLPLVMEANWSMLLCCFYLFKLMLSYLFQDYEQALDYANLAAKYLDGVMGMLMPYEFNFYHSLVLLARCDRLDTEAQSQALQQVAANQEILKVKAFHAPMNFQHKYDLVEAEKARVLGENLTAMDYYDASIVAAKNHGYTQIEALANELAANFYLGIHKEKIAKTYMTDAYYSYLSWGATAKVKHLSTNYPYLIVKNSEKTNGLTRSVNPSLTSTSGSISALLDLATVVKASVAIASEIVLDNLLAKLIKILMENAGAEKGILISENSGELVIEAVGVVEDNEVVLLKCLTGTNIADQLPTSIINYVFRSKETIVLNQAHQEGIFAQDSYIVKNQPKSVLCTPIIHQGQLKSILYLENQLTTGAFTVERLELLRLLSAQVAVSLENALLYRNLSNANTQLEHYAQTLEIKVAERTQELSEKNIKLEHTTAELKVLNQELEAFSFAVSHDLRAPLRRIGNFSQMLARSAGEQLNEKSKDYLSRIQIANQQMGQLIEDLLRLSKISRSEIHRRKVDLSAMVSAIAQELQKDDPERQVQLQIAPEVSVYADSDLLRAAIENLINNAWKYTRKRSCAMIEFNVISKENSHLLPNCDAQIVYFVRDNGAGFDMSYIDKLFKPFQRLHSASEFEGTGVGLATVERIIHRHGGEIWAESAIEQGTTFYFTLGT